jgi:hypothetical protein
MGILARAIRLAERSAGVYGDGAIERRQGKWGESNANLEKAGSLSPNEPWFLQNLSFKLPDVERLRPREPGSRSRAEMSPESLELWALQAQVEVAAKGTFESRIAASSSFRRAAAGCRSGAAVVAGAQIRLMQGRYAEALRQTRGLSDEVAAAAPEGLCAKYVIHRDSEAHA